MGGMLKAVEKNFIQRQITEAGVKQQRRIESGEEKVVGVSVFEERDERIRIEILRIPLELEKKQLNRLDKVRRERDSGRAQKALKKLEEVARRGENTIEATVEAVRSLATTGEIGVLYRKVYGQYVDPGL
jgi:methylmalonyl-CoA mutase N-terminal domain/subunit